MKIAFIGAGSTVFMRNIVGDILQYPALNNATLSLMDIDETRLDESRIVVERMFEKLGSDMVLECSTDQKSALNGADFVIVTFQIGGYEPCTVTDFGVPKSFGLEQTIGDTLGIGGIMRGLRTVPHLWAICEDMLEVCPDAYLLQYVNPMAINCWAIAEKFPSIKQVGLCHSVQATVEDLAHDLDLNAEDIRYETAGINHMSFYSKLEHAPKNGEARDLYPLLREGYTSGNIPKPNRDHARCLNKVRYEMMMRFGYFVTESSEHFSEYVPWFIKRDRPDLIEQYSIPLDEYPKRCVEQVEAWNAQAAAMKNGEVDDVERSHEYAAIIINAITTGTPAVIYGNVKNDGYVPQLPESSVVEVACLVDGNGIHPTTARDIPPQLICLMRTNINVQEMTVRALISESRDHVYHAALLDPHTAAELDIDQIYSLVDALITEHGEWLPAWLHQ